MFNIFSQFVYSQPESNPTDNKLKKMIRTILLLSPVYISFFWMIILHLESRKSGSPKRFLGKFMMVTSVLYFSHFLFFSRLFHIYIFFDAFYTSASLAVYPMYYIYVRLLTGELVFSFRKHAPYLFIPILFFVFDAIALLIPGREARMDYITRILTGIDPPQGNTVIPYSIYIAGRVVFILQVIVYMLFVNKLLRRHRQRLADFYSEPGDRSLRWVSILNILYFIASIASISLAFIGRERFLVNDILLVFPSIVFSVLLFIIGYLGSRQNPSPSPLKYADNGGDITELNESARDKLRKDMEILFEKDKIYLLKDLKISDVSNRLGTNRTYVSNIINRHYKVNFAGYVNNYRVNYARELLKDQPGIGVEELTDRSGFGSVNSLYRAFQSKENISLSRYRKKYMA